MKIILWICFLCTPLNILAKDGFLYIEGLRNIPLKVEVDGNDVSIAGSGYLIWPYNVGGRKQIRISSGDGQIAQQIFYLQLVDGGSYGFQLVRSGDEIYYLKDLVNEGKVIEANLPAPITSESQNNLRTVAPVAMNQHVKSGSNQLQSVKKIIEDSLQVMPSVSSSSEGLKSNQQQESAASNQVQKMPAQMSTANGDNLQSSMSNDRPCIQNVELYTLQGIIQLMAKEYDDETKISLLQRESLTLCFSAAQLKELGLSFETQYGRFTFAKAMYKHCSNVGNYKDLESLFMYADYRERFLRWLQSQSSH